jgi:DNA-binding PadR family transcriptional regulator
LRIRATRVGNLLGGARRTEIVAARTKLKPSVKLAVLGLLLERPSYGYELVARFERAFSESPLDWRVSPQAIYNSLGDLEMQELIEEQEGVAGEQPEARDQRGGPRSQRLQRRNLRVTGEGARAMREWLARPMPSSPSHEELLIRLHFGDANDEAMRKLLRLHLAECLEELERIGALPNRTRIERLVNEDRRLAVQSRLSWIDFALAELRGPDDQPIRSVDEA